MFVPVRFAWFLVIAVLVNSPVWASADPDLERTWDNAEIWVKPGGENLINTHMDDQTLQQRLIDAGRKLPTVIFFHDCARNRKLAGWHYARFMARAGFAVVLPNSFARESRAETCGYWQFNPLPGAPVEQVHAQRKAEIGHALAKVRELSWVDGSNLFVMGHGEGGDALAAYSGDGYQARVISGALCHWGVNGNATAPMMVVASRDDRLFDGADAEACVKKAGDYSVHIKILEGYQHDTSSLSEARDAVIDFLTLQIKP